VRFRIQLAQLANKPLSVLSEFATKPLNYVLVVAFVPEILRLILLMLILCTQHAPTLVFLTHADPTVPARVINKIRAIHAYVTRAFMVQAAKTGYV
jgi:hypothetical protein